MFVVLDIFENNENKEIPIFSDPLPNSANASRPIAILIGKENSEKLGEFIPIIQN